ncbi:uncharacterized protein [Branchiostoma lanceolatum]
MGAVVIQHWKLWLELFLGTKRNNYSCEAANLLANLKADWSPYMAYIHTHNRCVNITGEEGKAKPVDMLGEHYNRVIKKTCSGAGGRLEFKHARDISLSVQLFEAAKQFTDSLCATKTSHHTTTSAEVDIQSIMASVLQHEVHLNKPRRSLGTEWVDPRAVARERLYDNKWLANFLARGKQHISDDTEPPESLDTNDREDRESEDEDAEVEDADGGDEHQDGGDEDADGGDEDVDGRHEDGRDEENPVWEDFDDTDLMTFDLA